MSEACSLYLEFHFLCLLSPSRCQIYQSVWNDKQTNRYPCCLGRTPGSRSNYICSLSGKVSGILIQAVHHSQSQKGHLIHPGPQNIRVQKMSHGIQQVSHYLHQSGTLSGLCGHQRYILAYPYISSLSASPLFFYGHTAPPVCCNSFALPLASLFLVKAFVQGVAHIL